MDTDWDVVFPAAVSDEYLSGEGRQQDVHPATSLDTEAESEAAPLVVGFVHLIKLFSRVREIITTKAYQPCLTFLPRWVDTLGCVVPTGSLVEAAGSAVRSRDTASITSLELAREMIESLRHIVSLAPVQLRFSTPVASSGQSQGFGVARATLHSTCLYLQSVLLENSFIPRPSSGGDQLSCPDRGGGTSANNRFGGSRTRACDEGAEAELRDLQEGIAKNLLELLDHTPFEILELNGFSLVSGGD